MTHASAITVRQLGPGDAANLCTFYNGLSEASRRTFRPLGATTTSAACQAVCNANAGGEKYDLVAWSGRAIIGWGFVWELKKAEPLFGLAVADAHQGRGLGPDLTRRVLEECDNLGLLRVVLTVVKDNLRARAIYERHGFTTYGEFHHDEDQLDYYRMERLLPARK